MNTISEKESYDVVARFYDLEFKEWPDAYEFYIDFAKKLGSPVLELGCGTGNVLIPIAKACFEVWGLDNSKEMLEIARQKVMLLNEAIVLKIHLKYGDIRDFSLPKKFNLIIIPFGPFHNLTTIKDQTNTLRNIHKHLTRKGLFILDLMTPKLLAKATVKIIKEIEDEKRNKITITQWGKFKEHESILKTYRVFKEVKKDGTTQMTSWEENTYCFTKEEIESLLSNEGFSILNVYKNFKKEPYDENSPLHMYFITKKK